MRKRWELYYYECEKLVSGLLDSIAHILGIDESFFQNKSDNHTSALRAANYYILNEDNSWNNENNINTRVRCSEHSDWGTLTLLRQDNVGGLQIESSDIDNYNCGWNDVISDFYDFIVNIGDLMQRWTNDRFKSTRHRVVTSVTNYSYHSNINNISSSNRIDVTKYKRQSMAFFHLVNNDAVIETIPSCLTANETSKYKRITGWQYLQTKHLSTQVES